MSFRDLPRVVVLLAAIGLVWLVAASLSNRITGRIRSTV